MRQERAKHDVKLYRKQNGFMHVLVENARASLQR